MAYQIEREPVHNVDRIIWVLMPSFCNVEIQVHLPATKVSEQTSLLLTYPVHTSASMAEGSVRLTQADILHSVPQSIPPTNYQHLYTAHSAGYKQSISLDNNMQDGAQISAYVDLEGVQAVALDA
jgi:hypothetical protein